MESKIFRCDASKWSVVGYGRKKMSAWTIEICTDSVSCGWMCASFTSISRDERECSVCPLHRFLAQTFCVCVFAMFIWKFTFRFLPFILFVQNFELATTEFRGRIYSILCVRNLHFHRCSTARFATDNTLNFMAYILLPKFHAQQLKTKRTSDMICMWPVPGYIFSLFAAHKACKHDEQASIVYNDSILMLISNIWTEYMLVASHTDIAMLPLINLPKLAFH